MGVVARGVNFIVLRAFLRVWMCGFVVFVVPKVGNYLGVWFMK